MSILRHPLSLDMIVLVTDSLHILGTVPIAVAAPVMAD